MTKNQTQNQNMVSLGMDFLKKRIQTHLKLYFDPSLEISSFTPSVDLSAYFRNVLGVEPGSWSDSSLLVLFIALAPHIQPNFFDQCIQETLPQAGDFPQIGGVRGKQFRGFLPTGETVLFLLPEKELAGRMLAQEHFSPDHFFNKKRILWLEAPPAGEPRMSGKLIMNQEWVELLTTGKVSRPHFSMDFPAERLESQLNWTDLVLHPETMKQVQELQRWISYGDQLLHEWGLGKRIKPGYRTLFYGPPGTGKTLTASLLGKSTGRDVYRVDLSMVVSKFIGETEKNLANLFARAEQKDWILFFDEADALFGKRTEVRDAHDKYANQEVSYLLQRIEAFEGLVILATNLKTNLDDAFARRFQSIIYFPLPRTEERLRLWHASFPPQIELAPDCNLFEIAKEYEITGASILNIVQDCCLSLIEQKKFKLTHQLLTQAILKEFRKEEKSKP